MGAVGALAPKAPNEGTLARQARAPGIFFDLCPIGSLLGGALRGRT